MPTSPTPLLAERTHTCSSPTPTGVPADSPRPSNAVGVDCCSKVIRPCTHLPASYGRGVLTVTIPVAETAQPRKVAIAGTLQERLRVPPAVVLRRRHR